MDITTIKVITYVIMAVIAAMTIYALLSDRPRVALNAPSILTSLGIFGTFLGITVGLSAFDPDDIKASIPFLFTGIKLAFWTSVAGILGGILVKFRHLLFPVEESAAGARVKMEDLVGAMRGVERSLTDEDKSSLLAGLRNLQQEANEKSDDLRSALDSLAGALDAGRDRDAAMLNQLEGIGSDSQGILQAIREGAKTDAEAIAKLTEQLTAGQAALAEGFAGSSAAGAEQIGTVAAAIKGLQEVMMDDDAALLERLDRLGAGSEAATKRMTESGVETAAQMRGVAEAIESLQSAMGGDTAAMLERLEAMRKGSDALAERLVQVLGSGNEAMARALEQGRDALAAQIAAAVTDLRDALVGPDGLVKDLGQRMQDGQIELASALARVSEGLRGALGEDLKSLNERLAKSSTETAAQMRGVAEAIESLEGAMGGDAVAMLERLDAMRDGSDALGERLAQILGASDAAMNKALEQGRDTLAAQIASAVTDLRDALVGPDGMAGKLGQRLQDGQLELATALARISDGMRGALADDVESLNQRLAQSSAETAEQMRSVAEAIESLQGAMGGDAEAMLGRLDAMRDGSDALGERLAEILSAGNQAMAKALEQGRDALAAQIATAVTDLRDALVGPDGAANALGQRLQQGQADLAGALLKASAGVQEALSGDMAGMLERVDGLSEGLHNLADSVASSFGETAGGLSGDIGNMTTAVADAIDDLRMAIVGPEGARDGIVDELRVAHAATDKSLGAIRAALEENTKRQVDYSPKGLMTVLEDLIKQFNTQFSGQFWETLGGFNQAIAELINWMSAYRKQLGDMVDQQTKTARNMDTATRRFDEVASKSEIFIDVSKNISSLLGGLDSQRVQMESHLKRFAHIVDETASNLENIEEKIVAGNTQMNEHISEISERIEDQVIRVDRAMDEELRKALVSFGQQLAALSEKFVEDYTPLTDRLREVVNMARAV